MAWHCKLTGCAYDYITEHREDCKENYDEATATEKDQEFQTAMQSQSTTPQISKHKSQIH
jgi:hypothetical protein